MSELYYTPKIEDFHIGFEYEYLEENGEWVKVEGPEEISEEEYDEQEYGLRVKYLDREDIESLGWKHTGRSIDDWFKWEEPVRLESGHRIKFTMHYGYHDQKLTINGDESGTNTCFFEGYIKNKSEFKKLMKQLTINN
jgi:hypothetical protein